MISIRRYDPATPADINAITYIYAHHVLHGRASFETEPPSLEDMRGRLDRLVADDYPVLVAETDGAVRGYAYAGQHKARRGYRLTVEDSVYVHHLATRHGIGHALLKALITAGREGGYHQMMAVIGDSANEPSIALHRAHGFRHVGTARNIGFKFGEFLDVVYMQRALNEDHPTD